jgi:hypothetical protein
MPAHTPRSSSCRGRRCCSPMTLASTTDGLQRVLDAALGKPHTVPVWDWGAGQLGWRNGVPVPCGSSVGLHAGVLPWAPAPPGLVPTRDLT